MAESTDLATDLARTPKLRSENPEMIPKRLLQGMLALVLATVALVGYAALTGRAHVGVPQPSTVNRGQRTPDHSGRAFRPGCHGLQH